MKTSPILASILMTALASVSTAAADVPADATSTARAEAFLGRDWIVQASDNICGLRDARQLTNPAVIDFQACLDATPEMKKVRDKGIDPASARGIQLKNAAVTRVTNACDAVQKANAHCSVWKAIRHKDGRTITDISSLVQARY